MAWTRLKIIILSVAICSCSSMTLKVESQPSGAEVYSQVNRKQKKWGVTPLELSASQIQGDNIHLIIKKEGFEPQSMILEKRSISSKAEIFAQLDNGANGRSIASTGTGNIDKQVTQISRTVASIQTQLIKKNFQSAETIAQSLVTEYPYFAVGWSLLGNAFYLQNRHQDALQAYYKAMEYDPDNLETQNLIDRIERKPARSER